MIGKETADKIRNNLWDYMVKNNFSSQKIEKDTGISRHTISSFLKDKGKTRILTMARLQRYLEDKNMVRVVTYEYPKEFEKLTGSYDPDDRPQLIRKERMMPLEKVNNLKKVVKEHSTFCSYEFIDEDNIKFECDKDCGKQLERI